jgi:DNA invertase Pin-like site-specific DNA recombinase
MASIFGYIRTSRRLQEGVPGMDPASQELQLRRAGVPLANIHRDVGISGTTGTQGRQGWHQLDGRLAGGDTLLVVAIDRIGRT